MFWGGGGRWPNVSICCNSACEMDMKVMSDHYAVFILTAPQPIELRWQHSIEKVCISINCTRTYEYLSPN